jgi:ABC-type oligopeptide transport system substrate-binding subunit
MLDGKLDLLLQPPPDKLKSLASASHLKVQGPMPNRRIYFLAINHQVRLLHSDDMRKALAFSVEREKLLREHLRSNAEDKYHKALSGPYPPGSWAADASARSLDRPDQGKLLLQKASEKIVDLKEKELTLSLKYDKSDPAAKVAMEALRDQVTKNLGIHLELEGLEPDALREQVEKTGNYELAYYHYDFEGDTYWLWPLLDPAGINYLHFKDEGAIQLGGLFTQMLNHRSFAELQRLSRLVHEAFLDQMPFIPLWQLHTFLVHNVNLKLKVQDPLLIFPGVENWSLQRN